MKEKLFALGFREDSSNQNILTNNINNYVIKVVLNQEDLSSSTIDYGPKIEVHHSGICNLSKEENLVQLECVIRLLQKGYKPSSIELEKTYKLGHNEKGRLDVYIKKGDETWGLIECKTYGKEYQIERNNMLQDGGQVFSYFTQDRSAEVIGIYASRIDNEVIDYVSEQIFTSEIDKNGDVKKIHASWDRSFVNNGIFDQITGIYETKRVNLRKENLIDLTKDTGKSIFNDFAEILRKYVISDKSNAFNVIFNLFVCKIYDEDIKGDTEELDFQMKTGDDDRTLLNRLSFLYKESVEKYLSLKMDTKYFSSDDKIALKEFQFIDVFNDETFNLNCKILSEVVLILQKYRIKYSTKHQFLGEFFENLLHTGIKQESGQYFTPIPLTRFILKSLPIQNIINDKIQKKDPYILPHIIDYACGAGHFLTEAIEEINSHFADIKTSSLSGQQQRFFNGTKDNYLWAKDYIYGIEKDHRLAKTTKIAMFLNGDGDAFVLSGDGLDDFYYSTKYNQKLKAQKPSQSISTFDIVVSNPPFSVDGFFNNLKNGASNFSSYKFITQKSTEIECFFIERTIQLLKENGVAGLVLPLSILSNNRSVYINSRKMLLLYTEIVGVVELREKAFMATGTAACIVFFKKRSISEFEKNTSALLEKYKNDDKHSSLSDVVADLLYRYKSGNLDSKIFNTEYFDELIEMSNLGSKVIMAFSGEKKRQEYFLGYRFSKARGREGLSLLKQSLLYNFSGKLTNDKIDHYIRDAFLGKFDSVPSGELQKHLVIKDFSDVLNIQESYNISNPSSYLAQKTIKINSISPYGDFIDNYTCMETSLAELIKDKKVQTISGLIYNKTEDEVPEETQVRVLTASNLNLRTGLLEFGNKMIHLREDYPIDNNLEIKEGDIIMCMSSGSLSHLGKVVLADKAYPKLLIGGFLNLIRANTKELALALYYRFMSQKFREYVFSKKGQNINNLKMGEIANIKINIPVDLTTFVNEVNKLKN